MDDFSFPTITVDQDSHCQLPFPHFAASPLWFFTSERTEAESAGMQWRSLSAAVGTPELLIRDFKEGITEIEPRDQEEGMDMLWEDFNEELHRMSHELRGSLNNMSNRNQFDRKQDMVELCCVHALRESQNGSMIRHRKTGLILMLKKLFLIRKANSSGTASVN